MKRTKINKKRPVLANKKCVFLFLVITFRRDARHCFKRVNFTEANCSFAASGSLTHACVRAEK